MRLLGVVTVALGFDVRGHAELPLVNDSIRVQDSMHESGGAAITVCIPCRPRHVSVLKRVLESVLAQTLQPAEVIIQYSGRPLDSALETARKAAIGYVDVPSGESPDQLAAGLREAEALWQRRAPGVPLRVNAEDKEARAGENRNRCAASASSPVVSYIDADDLMQPRRLEILARVFEQYHPVAVVHGDKVVPSSGCGARDLPASVPEPTSDRILAYRKSLVEGARRGSDEKEFGEFGVHYGHVTVLKSAFTAVQYHDDKIDEWGFPTEDQDFLRDLQARYGEEALVLYDGPLSVYCH